MAVDRRHEALCRSTGRRIRQRVIMGLSAMSVVRLKAQRLDPVSAGMDLARFAALHVPALEADEARFSLHIASLTSAEKDEPLGLRLWSLGAPGHCAMQWPGRAILLGNLDRAECHELAEATMAIGAPGVVGAAETAHWFVEQAIAMGAEFEAPIPQRIHVLSSPPRYPGVQGSARAMRAAEAPLLREWLVAFQKEAVPHDPPPDPGDAERAAGTGRYLFWTVDDAPVAMAAIARRLRRTGALSSVYTPPQQRGRGYAGSVTAAAADKLFAEGKTTVCLYTDLRNPMSNRCYAKIGFRPHCDSWHYLRRACMQSA
jgi:RimJ/RimL family protein N-acetyltransferase